MRRNGDGRLSEPADSLEVLLLEQGAEQEARKFESGEQSRGDSTSTFEE